MEHATALVDNDATTSYDDDHLRDFCTDAEAAETAAFMQAYVAERGLAAPKKCSCQKLVAAGWQVTCRACGRGASLPDAILIAESDVLELVATYTEDAGADYDDRRRHAASTEPESRVA